jgi:alpha-tubulin suppressor-like RCC1 family protein
MCENNCRPAEIKKRLLDNKGGVEQKIKQIAAGESVSLILRLNGQLLITGKHDFRGVQSDDYQTYSLPSVLTSEVQVNQIACGYDHYLFSDS